MSVELTLTCTCGTGSGGLVQEVLERRMAPRLGIPVADVHNILDLFDRVLDGALDIPPGERGPDMIAQGMAERSGIPLARIKEIFRVWDEESERSDREDLAMRTGDYLGIPRTT